MPTPPDIRIQTVGSVRVLMPLTPAGVAWLDYGIAGDKTWIGGGLIVEPQSLASLVAAMEDAGIGIQRE
ncbi:hypothetical protein WDZ92_50590 [Nostoc sp. NIES-2111]